MIPSEKQSIKSSRVFASEVPSTQVLTFLEGQTVKMLRLRNIICAEYYASKNIERDSLAATFQIAIRQRLYRYLCLEDQSSSNWNEKPNLKSIDKEPIFETSRNEIQVYMMQNQQMFFIPETNNHVAVPNQHTGASLTSYIQPQISQAIDLATNSKFMSNTITVLSNFEKQQQRKSKEPTIAEIDGEKRTILQVKRNSTKLVNNPVIQNNSFSFSTQNGKTQNPTNIGFNAESKFSLVPKNQIKPEHSLTPQLAHSFSPIKNGTIGHSFSTVSSSNQEHTFKKPEPLSHQQENNFKRGSSGTNLQQNNVQIFTLMHQNKNNRNGNCLQSCENDENDQDDEKEKILKRKIEKRKKDNKKLLLGDDYTEVHKGKTSEAFNTKGQNINQNGTNQLSNANGNNTHQLISHQNSVQNQPFSPSSVPFYHHQQQSVSNVQNIFSLVNPTNIHQSKPSQTCKEQYNFFGLNKEVLSMQTKTRDSLIEKYQLSTSGFFNKSQNNEKCSNSTTNENSNSVNIRASTGRQNHYVADIANSANANSNSTNCVQVTINLNDQSNPSNLSDIHQTLSPATNFNDLTFQASLTPDLNNTNFQTSQIPSNTYSNDNYVQKSFINDPKAFSLSSQCIPIRSTLSQTRNCQELTKIYSQLPVNFMCLIQGLKDYKSLNRRNAQLTKKNKSQSNFGNEQLQEQASSQNKQISELLAEFNTFLKHSISNHDDSQIQPKQSQQNPAKSLDIFNQIIESTLFSKPPEEIEKKLNGDLTTGKFLKMLNMYHKRLVRQLRQQTQRFAGNDQSGQAENRLSSYFQNIPVNQSIYSKIISLTSDHLHSTLKDLNKLIHSQLSQLYDSVFRSDKKQTILSENNQPLIMSPQKLSQHQKYLFNYISSYFSSFQQLQNSPLYKVYHYDILMSNNIENIASLSKINFALPTNRENTSNKNKQSSDNSQQNQKNLTQQQMIEQLQMYLTETQLTATKLDEAVNLMLYDLEGLQYKPYEELISFAQSEESSQSVNGFQIIRMYPHFNFNKLSFDLNHEKYNSSETQNIFEQELQGLNRQDIQKRKYLKLNNREKYSSSNYSITSKNIIQTPKYSPKFVSLNHFYPDSIDQRLSSSVTFLRSLQRDMKSFQRQHYLQKEAIQLVRKESKALENSRNHPHKTEMMDELFQVPSILHSMASLLQSVQNQLESMQIFLKYYQQVN